MKLTDLHTNDGQLEGLPSNPRFITEEDFNLLKMRILQMPQYLRHNRIKIEEHNVILAGNMRYLALQSLAAEKAVAKWNDRYGEEHIHHFTDEIPDEWVEHLDDYTLEDKLRIVLLDNSQNGQDDIEKLANEWDEQMLRDWGNGVPTDWDKHGEEEIEENTAKEDDFDEDKEVIEVRCKRGDIWQLGEHRLMCGDSIQLEEVKRLTGGG